CARVGRGGYHCGAQHLAPVPDVRANTIAMYQRILVAVENSPSDRAILTHIVPLATMTGAELLLVHVADGFAARHFQDLKLRESEEMRDDRAYLERLCEDMCGKGMVCAARLAMGDPATELVRVAVEEGVDLIAMSTHGHRFLQ